MSVRGEPIGMGSVTPSLQTISGGYRYRRDPGCYPGHPAYREVVPRATRHATGSMADRAAKKREKQARYDKLRDEGMSRRDAAAAIGVAVSTGKAYETRWSAARQEPAP